MNLETGNRRQLPDPTGDPISIISIRHVFTDRHKLCSMPPVMSFPIDPAQVIRHQDFRHLNECGSNRRNIYSHRSASLLMFHVKHQPHNRQLVVMRNHSIFSNKNSRQVSDISSSTIESGTKSNTNNWKTNIWQSTNRYMVVANADMIKSLDH